MEMPLEEVLDRQGTPLPAIIVRVGEGLVGDAKAVESRARHLSNGADGSPRFQIENLPQDLCTCLDLRGRGLAALLRGRALRVPGDRRPEHYPRLLVVDAVMDSLAGHFRDFPGPAEAVTQDPHLEHPRRRQGYTGPAGSASAGGLAHEEDVCIEPSLQVASNIVPPNLGTFGVVRSDFSDVLVCETPWTGVTQRRQDRGDSR